MYFHHRKQSQKQKISYFKQKNLHHVKKLTRFTKKHTILSEKGNVRKPIKYNPENTYYGKLRSGTPKIYIMPKGEAR